MSLLNLRGVNKVFGGVVAADQFNLDVEREEFTAIIGPNGAGKTTLFNLITRRVPLDSGKVLFKGEDITHLSSHQIVRKGIGRSFQRTNMFPMLTSLENMQMAILSHQKRNLNMVSPAKNMVKEKALEILDSFGLGNQADVKGDALAHGDQRRLEVALTLAVEPELLLLDEPTCGMAPWERLSMVDLVERIARERGLTLVFIEHDMDIVFNKARRIVVMHEGKVFFDGKPEEVKRNAGVREIYLGKEQ